MTSAVKENLKFQFTESMEQLPPELRDLGYEAVVTHNRLTSEYVDPVTEAAGAMHDSKDPKLIKATVSLFKSFPNAIIKNMDDVQLEKLGITKNWQNIIRGMARGNDETIEHAGDVQKRAYYDVAKSQFTGPDKNMMINDAGGLTGIGDKYQSVMAGLRKSRTQETVGRFESMRDIINMWVSHQHGIIRQAAVAPIESVGTDPTVMRRLVQRAMEAEDRAITGSSDQSRADAKFKANALRNKIREMEMQKKVNSDAFAARLEAWANAPERTNMEKTTAEYIRSLYTGDIHKNTGYSGMWNKMNTNAVENVLANSGGSILRAAPDILRVDASNDNIAFGLKAMQNAHVSNVIDKLRVSGLRTNYVELHDAPEKGVHDKSFDAFDVAEHTFRKWAVAAHVKELADRDGITFDQAIAEIDKNTPWGKKAAASALREVSNSQGSVSALSAIPVQTGFMKGPATLKGSWMREAVWFKDKINDLRSGDPMKVKKAQVGLARYVMVHTALKGGKAIVDPKVSAFLYNIGADKIPYVQNLLMWSMTDQGAGNSVLNKTIGTAPFSGSVVEFPQTGLIDNAIDGISSQQSDKGKVLQSLMNFLPRPQVPTPFGKVNLGYPMINRGVDAVVKALSPEPEKYRGATLEKNVPASAVRVLLPSNAEKSEITGNRTIIANTKKSFAKWYYGDSSAEKPRDLNVGMEHMIKLYMDKGDMTEEDARQYVEQELNKYAVREKKRYVKSEAQL